MNEQIGERMKEMSGSSPGQLTVRQFMQLLEESDDPDKVTDAVSRYMKAKQAREAASYTRSTRPVRHPGQDDPAKEWMCPLCFTVTYQKYMDEHLHWHDNERERLLAVAVELLGVLGALNDG